MDERKGLIYVRFFLEYLCADGVKRFRIVGQNKPYEIDATEYVGDLFRKPTNPKLSQMSSRLKDVGVVFSNYPKSNDLSVEEQIARKAGAKFLQSRDKATKFLKFWAVVICILSCLYFLKTNSPVIVSRCPRYRKWGVVWERMAENTEKLREAKLKVVPPPRIFETRQKTERRGMRKSNSLRKRKGT